MLQEFSIGVDTGGTYTDAVALDGQRRVVASAKSLTTPWDLSIGLDGAIRAVLAKLPEGARREQISLVAVSTTLATNAVVENRFSSICTILIGFDEKMVERSNLRRGGGGVVVRVGGGHDGTGEEAQPLDEAAIDAAVREHGAQVEAFAVAAMFSVRNPAHERRARERIRAICPKPVTCSHELSSQLDAPKRALTAALNARLTPQIAHLLEALRRVLERESITAPVMIVKGDGTLMRAEVALEYPVETVLSGPAASVVGAGFLQGLEDFLVADMGGTTTDVAIVLAGRPIVRAEGAVIGGWRTMIEAIDVHTCGLGGDSEVGFDRERRLNVGPRKTMPLSLLATQFPQVLAELALLAAEEYPPPHGAQFAYRNPGRDPGTTLDRVERRIWESLELVPRRFSGSRAPDLPPRHCAGWSTAVWRRLPGSPRAMPCTCWDVSRAGAGRRHNSGAAILATEERNALARRDKDTPEQICGRTYEFVLRKAATGGARVRARAGPGHRAEQWPLGCAGCPARANHCRRRSSPTSSMRSCAWPRRWSRSVRPPRRTSRRSRAAWARSCSCPSTRRSATPWVRSPG